MSWLPGSRPAHRTCWAWWTLGDGTTRAIGQMRPLREGSARRFRHVRPLTGVIPHLVRTLSPSLTEPMFFGGGRAVLP
jgi:hypothetical protein